MSTFYFGQELRVFLQTGTSLRYYEIVVTTPPTFGQQSDIQTITTNSMPGGGDVHAVRHQTHSESFETSLSDVTFNLSTHIRPYQDSNVENAVEAALWSFLVDPNTTPPTSSTEFKVPPFILEDPVNKFNLYFIYGTGSGSLPGYKISNCVLESANLSIGKGAVNTISWAGKGTTLEQTTLNVASLTIQNSAGVAKTDNYISTDKLSYMESNGLTQSLDGGEFRQGLGHYGRSVSMSGNVLVVGQHWMDNPLMQNITRHQPGPGYTYDGGAHVYSTQDEGRTWSLEGRIATPPVLDDETYTYASHVTVEGNHIAIGGYGYEAGVTASGTDDVGGVATYTREFVDGQVKFLPGSKVLQSSVANEEDDNFGKAVDISGDYMIVGIPGFDYSDEGKTSASSNNGMIEFWKYNNGWNFHSRIVGTFGSAHYFGIDVCIHGDYAIALAFGDLAFLYRDPITDTWSIAQTETMDGLTADTELDTISMSANYAVIGQPGLSSEDLGRATIWKLTGTPGSASGWTIFQTIGPTETNPAHRPVNRLGTTSFTTNYLKFGDSTAIDPVTESTIIVGARQNSITFGDSTIEETGAGAAYVFKLNKEGTAFEFAKRLDKASLTTGQSASFSAENNNFGLSVAIYNDMVAVGAPEEDNATHNSLLFNWYDGDGNPVNHTVDEGGTKHVLRVAKNHTTFVSGDEQHYPRNGGSFTLGGVEYYLHNNTTTGNYDTSDYRSFEVSKHRSHYAQDTTTSSHRTNPSEALVLTQSELATLVSANSLSSSSTIEIFERQEGMVHTYKLSDTTLAVNGLLPITEASFSFSYPTQSITYPILGEVTSTIDYKRGPLQIQGNISGYIFNSDDQRDGEDFISTLLASENQHTDLEFHLGGRAVSTNRVRMHFPKCILSKPEISIDKAATYKLSFIALSTNPLGNSTNTSNAVAIEYKSSSTATRA